MTPTTAPNCTNTPDTARKRSISPESGPTLKDLIERIELEQGKDDQTTAMLRTTAGYIALCLKRRPERIAVTELTDDLREQLRAYLRELKKPTERREQ